MFIHGPDVEIVTCERIAAHHATIFSQVTILTISVSGPRIQFIYHQSHLKKYDKRETIQDREKGIETEASRTYEYMMHFYHLCICVYLSKKLCHDWDESATYNIHQVPIHRYIHEEYGSCCC